MRQRNVFVLTASLSLGLALVACQPPNTPQQAAGSQTALKQRVASGTSAPSAAPEYVAKSAEVAPLTAKLMAGTSHDTVTFDLGGTFKTQALDTSTLAYVRIWVTGPDISTPIYASGGDEEFYIPVAGSPD